MGWGARIMQLTGVLFVFIRFPKQHKWVHGSWLCTPAVHNISSVSFPCRRGPSVSLPLSWPVMVTGRWLLIRITPIYTCFYTKIIYSLNVSFAHHICCCLIFCNHFNYFIDQDSKLDRFSTWHIFIVGNNVK